MRLRQQQRNNTTNLSVFHDASPGEATSARAWEDKRKLVVNTLGQPVPCGAPATYTSTSIMAIETVRPTVFVVYNLPRVDEIRVG